MMAGLRSSILHLAQEVGGGLATAMRTLNNCFSQALSLLGLPQIEYTRRGEKWHDWSMAAKGHKLGMVSTMRPDQGDDHAGILLFR
jgi:hypothetical protein